MPGALIEETQPEVAIVGGGIVGLILAVGLIHRGVKVKVFEQAQGFREIGAGIAFTANTIRCMHEIDPAIPIALRECGSVALSSGDSKDPDTYLRWLDGFNRRVDGDMHGEKFLCEINAGYKGIEGCRRDQLLEALMKVIPPGTVELKKRLETVQDKGLYDKVGLTFVDGSTAEADAIIACDGIKSRLREILLGKGNPASYPHYTHKFAYRGMVPMDKALQVLGQHKGTNQYMHIGPGAHLIHYPIANNTVVNVTAFVTDLNEWADSTRLVEPAFKRDVEAVFADWNPCVRNLVSLLPEKLDKWAVFDLWDYPPQSFNSGKICLAGDAAHASSPHHGTGACFGVEDGLCLSVLLGQVCESVRKDPTVKGKAISTAFEAYDTVRRTRAQWLVNSSRRVCDLYHQQEWADAAKWTKAETCFEEIRDRSYKIWHFDYMDMVRRTEEEYDKRQKAFGGHVNGVSA